MRDSIKKSIGNTVQDLINSGAKTSFTEKELNALNVKIPEGNLTTAQIKELSDRLKKCSLRR